MDNNKKPSISIIVPVYNVEKYIEQCIQSIISQTHKNFELILVDDGSPDKSGTICDKYASNDDRIVVVHKENGGVSSARNVGINRATSDWITFIDSDDFIGKDYIKNLYAGTHYKDIDFVHGGCTNCSENGEIVGVEQRYENFSSNDKLLLLNNFRGLCFSKLFRRAIVEGKDIKFDNNIRIGEDMVFTMEYLTYVNSYSFVSDVSYYYRRRKTSATHITRQTYNEALYAFKKRKNILDRYRLTNSLYTPSIRENQLASIMLNVISLLYLSGVNRDMRIISLSEDFNEGDYSILHDYQGGKIKRIFSKLLIRKDFKLFDLLASTLYSIKYSIIHTT